MVRPGEGGTPWVWDASALHAAAAADRVDVLFDLASGNPQAPSRHVTTVAVAEELRRNQVWEPCRAHLEAMHVDGLDELHALGRWIAVVSSGRHSLGEATVLAWAEVHGGVPILDDKAAPIRCEARLASPRHSVGDRSGGASWQDPAYVRELFDQHTATGRCTLPVPCRWLRGWAISHPLIQE